MTSPYCKATYIIQSIISVYLFMATWNQLEQLITELPSLQPVKISTMINVLPLLSTSTYFTTKATTHESPVQTRDHHLISHLPSSLWPLVLKYDQISLAQPLFNSEQTLWLQQNGHPVAIQQLFPMEWYNNSTYLLVTTQLPFLYIAYLPQHLQQLITEHKIDIAPHKPVNIYHMQQKLTSKPDQVSVM